MSVLFVAESGGRYRLWRAVRFSAGGGSWRPAEDVMRLSGDWPAGHVDSWQVAAGMCPPLGATAWTEQNQFRLASESPADNTRWGKSRVTLAATDKVHFNQTKRFTFTVTAPATAGPFVFQWRMIDDPGLRFGALSTPVTITVR